MIEKIIEMLSKKAEDLWILAEMADSANEADVLEGQAVILEKMIAEINNEFPD